ncbi:MAG: hypothetical protein EOO01_19595 [Chitinophagaceae bacterium]|nr:MAG: hypothetical protein EOO01_19595 [Chitinophagaceae bacterium]
MNDSPKIQLSPFEQQLVTNYEWLLTKNGVLEKIKVLLAAVQVRQQQLLSEPGLPVAVQHSSAKISRGENYLGLPYLVLDQPRRFEKDNTFAIRTMFWWGHFFSITLQLSGSYKEQYTAQLAAAFSDLQEEDFYISHHASEWEHHFGADNYIPLNKLNEFQFRQQLQAHPFIKLAKKISLDQWDTIEEKIIQPYEVLVGVLRNS